MIMYRERVETEMRFRFPSARMQSHPYLPRRRYVPPMSTTAPIPRSKKFIHDVVLLGPDESDIIPRGIRRMALQKEGKIANMVELDTSWDDQHVYQVIEGCFSDLIDASKPYPR